MTRNLFQRSKAPPAPSAFQFTTPGGLALPTATLRRQLALVGGPLEVMHLTAHFMKQANEQQIPVILLGGPQDSAFLDLPDLLELNPVRTAALPRLLAGTSPEQLREVLTEATRRLMAAILELLCEIRGERPGAPPLDNPRSGSRPTDARGMR